MPNITRFGVLDLEWQPCTYGIPRSLRKQYLVCLRGVATLDIGTVELLSTF